MCSPKLKFEPWSSSTWCTGDGDVDWDVDWDVGCDVDWDVDWDMGWVGGWTGVDVVVGCGALMDGTGATGDVAAAGTNFPGGSIAMSIWAAHCWLGFSCTPSNPGGGCGGPTGKGQLGIVGAAATGKGQLGIVGAAATDVVAVEVVVVIVVVISVVADVEADEAIRKSASNLKRNGKKAKSGPKGA